ncbi:hypothetical protein T484DRAFT_1789583 [Baffinella frigidus]|nr:hypothetical protein T484DRAFT_1789583 [Cryptophyta sp. CCMP2293]
MHQTATPSGRDGKGQAAAAQVSRNDAAWDERLEELRLFAQGNGGLANVSQRDPERPGLGRWTLEVKGKLREDREIGFVFDLYEAAWDQSFEELRVFSGRCVVA